MADGLVKAVGYVDGRGSSRSLLTGLLFACGLLLSAATHAQSLDLEKPIQIEAGKGAVVFSITATYTPGVPQVKWRSLKEDGEKGSINPRGWVGDKHLVLPEEDTRAGHLYVLALAPGEYEFYDANLQLTQQTVLFGNPPFSRKFQVVAGEIQYAGNLDLLFRRSAGQHNAAVGMLLLLGTSSTYAITEPWLRNAAEKDIPLLLKTHSELRPDQIKVAVQSSAADAEMTSHLALLQQRAQSGDVAARHRLAAAYLYGNSTQADGSILRAMPDYNAGIAVLEGLIRQGDYEAAYELGRVYDGGGGYSTLVHGIGQAKVKSDTAKAAQYYTLAAQKYHSSAAQRLYYMLRRESRKDESRVWEARADKLEALDSRNWAQLPPASLNALTEYQASSDFPRAFAISRAGGYGAATGAEAGFGDLLFRAAIANCEKNNPNKAQPCTLFAHSGKVKYDICQGNEQARAPTFGFPPLSLPQASAESFATVAALKEKWDDWDAKSYPKAIALSADNVLTVVAGECAAAALALKQCTQQGGKNCELIVVDDRMVNGNQYAKQFAAIQ